MNGLEGYAGRSRAHESVELRHQSFWSSESCGLREKFSKFCLWEICNIYKMIMALLLLLAWINNWLIFKFNKWHFLIKAVLCSSIHW